MAIENQDPYDQAYWGKGKGKKTKKGKSKFQYPYDGNKGYPSYDSGKGTMPAGQTKIWIHHGVGVNQAGTHPMTHPAQDKH